VIFIMVGAFRGFDRLIREADRIAGDLGEDIIAQIGQGDYEPEHIESVRFMDRPTILEHISRASLVITHCGAGSINDCILHAQRFILVPRLVDHGEVIDGHQLDLARVFNEKHGIPVIWNDISTLVESIRSAPPNEVELGERDRLKDHLRSLANEHTMPGDRVVLAAALGGHFTQLLELSDAFSDTDHHFLTYRSRSTKNVSPATFFPHAVGPVREILMIMMNFVRAFFFCAEHRPKLIFSTGSADMTIPLALFGKLFGAHIIYLETISRVYSVSGTAKYIGPLADTFLVQWEHNLPKYPEHAEYHGSVF